MDSAEQGPRGLHLKSGLVLLGTFLAGAVAGAGVMAWARPPPPPPPSMGMGMAGGLGPPGPRRLPAFVAELNLPPEQEEKARAIFEKYRPELEAVFHDAAPRARAIGERMEAELRTVLTPEQAQRLEALKARQQRGPGPGGMGPRGMGPPPGIGGPPPDAPK